jgi:hypothetical protein
MSWEVSAGFSIVIAVPLFALYDLLRHIAPATHQGTEPLCSSADPPLRMTQLKRGNDSQAPTFCSARYHTTQREIQALKHRSLLGHVLTERGFLDINIGVSTRINELNAPFKADHYSRDDRKCNPSSGFGSRRGRVAPRIAQDKREPSAAAMSGTSSKRPRFLASSRQVGRFDCGGY